MKLHSLLFAACLIACPFPATAQDCTTPNSDLGVILYNLDYDVYQGCTKKGWVEFHSAGDFCPASGLVGHWKFNEATGSTTAADSSGSGNPGTLTNMDPNTDWVAGKLGNALDFDGANDKVLMGSGTNLLSGVSAATVSAWINSDLGNTDNQVAFDISINGGTGSRFDINILTATDEIRFGGRAGDGEGFQSETTTSRPLTANTWHHVVGMIDYQNDNVSIYVDGVLQPTTGTAAFTATSTSATSPQQVAIGNDVNAGTPDPFGLIDDVRVYNRALSAAEIDALYNGGAGCQ